VIVYKARAAPKMVPTTPIAPTKAPAPILPAPLGLLVAEAAELDAPLATPALLEVPDMVALVDML
jgi:hypothetical protein